MTKVELDGDDTKLVDYEASLERLEEIVALLESHDTRLQDAMKLYEEGVALARSCMDRLKDAELKITELKVIDTGSEE